MKKWQLASGILVWGILIGLTACSPSEAAGTFRQAVTAERGDLVVSISGSGNLDTYQDSRLSFGSAGKIADVLYMEGDLVNKGDVLAKLETDVLEVALTEARVNLKEAELAVTEAEIAVKQEPIAKDRAQLAVTQAEVNLKSAETALEQTTKSSSISDLRIAQADVETAQRNLADSLMTLGKYLPGTIGYEEYQKNVVLAQARLKTAQDKMDAMLSGFSTEEVAIKKQQVEIARQSLDIAKQLLEIELQPREVARQALTLAKQNLTLAQQSAELAQKRLDDATIIAPFDGVIADVKAKAGDVVDVATTVIYIVNPAQLEIVVEVDELDIPKVAVGQPVKIDVDALPDNEFTGTVASVYPVPTKVTGLVMYNVRIALAVPEDTGLKIGMRTTSNIIVDKRTDIIKLPNQVIKEGEQGGHFVNVLAGKKTEKRPVTIGISNSAETEIVAGLKEGENVVN